MELSIKIYNKNDTLLADVCDTDRATLFYQDEYSEGDYIVLTASCGYLMIQLDDVMNLSFVYMNGKDLVLKIPFNEKKIAYNPKAFSGNTHLLTARVASREEITAYKNLCHNEYDCHENVACFPHAFANVETRGESVFAAQNAINGNTANSSHGAWPYESWGINRDPNAKITIDFGREVTIDKLVLHTRADFPHDNWWKQVTFTFSDQTSLTVSMKKSCKPHVFSIPEKKVRWLSLGELIQDETDPSPFPALSQIEAYGR